MSFELEPKPELLTPQFWNGVDINNPNHFMGISPDYIAATKKEQRVAADHLASCLHQVLSGDFTEVKASVGNEFFADESVQDGTVVVLDREHLLKFLPANPRDRDASQEKPVGSGVPIDKPYANHWRDQQPAGISDHFGEESAHFPDVDAQYSRHLSWGVLVSRKKSKESGERRYLATWAFCAARSSSNGISIPTGGPYYFRCLETLPLDIQIARPLPSVQLQSGTTRMVERIRDIHIVHAANGKREPTPAFHKKIREWAGSKLGELTLPRPIPVPT